MGAGAGLGAGTGAGAGAGAGGRGHEEMVTLWRGEEVREAGKASLMRPVRARERIGEEGGDGQGDQVRA